MKASSPKRRARWCSLCSEQRAVAECLVTVKVIDSKECPAPIGDAPDSAQTHVFLCRGCLEIALDKVDKLETDLNPEAAQLWRTLEQVLEGHDPGNLVLRRRAPRFGRWTELDPEE